MIRRFRPINRVHGRLRRDEVERLNQLLANRDLEGSRAYLEELRGGLAGEPLFWVDEKIREIEGTIRYNRYIDDYNRAVDLYNDEDYGAAITILERIISTLPPGQQAQFAKALLNDARKAADAE